MNKKVILITGLIALLIVSLFALTGCGAEKETTNTNSNVQNTSKTETKENSVANTSEANAVVGNKKYEYTYKDGVLTPIVDEEGNPKQTDFVIDGIILIGNRHEYNRTDTMEYIEYFAKQGYKKEGINSSFYLGEWIEMYIDTKYAGSASDVKILITPHKTVEELEKLSLTQLEELANENGGYVIDYQAPEADNYKHVGAGYVNQDYPEGKYDILFTYKGKIAYFINVNLVKEPTE